MDNKRVAVVTDTVSSGFYFPLWYRYYGNAFGFRQLYVITYTGLSSNFRDFELGGLWEIPHRYEDGQRARTISSLVNSLLTSVDIVIRVDTDEFLVPDPNLHASLLAYIQNLSKPYVTARGMNVIQSDREQRLNFDRPILFEQRRFVQAVGPMNKTCVTSVPTEWAPGFHWCTHHPAFDDLFMFHLKHADMDLLMHFGDWMLEQVRGNKQFEEYYRPNRERLLTHQRVSFAYPCVQGLGEMYRRAFTEDFLATVQYVPSSKIYHGSAMYDKFLVELPDIFGGRL